MSTQTKTNREIAILLPARNADGSSTRTETISAVEIDSVPGLVAHPTWKGSDWSITHERSGRYVSRHPTEALALAEIRRLGALADWTLDAESLRAALGGRTP